MENAISLEIRDEAARRKVRNVLLRNGPMTLSALLEQIPCEEVWPRRGVGHWAIALPDGGIAELFIAVPMDGDETEGVIIRVE